MTSILLGESRGTSRYMLGASADEFWDTSKGQRLDQPSSQGPCRAGCPKSNPPLGAMWAQLSPQDVFTLGANQGLEFFTEIVQRRSFVICSDWHTWKKKRFIFEQHRSCRKQPWFDFLRLMFTQSVWKRVSLNSRFNPWFFPSKTCCGKPEFEIPPNIIYIIIWVCLKMGYTFNEIAIYIVGIVLISKTIGYVLGYTMRSPSASSHHPQGTTKEVTVLHSWPKNGEKIIEESRIRELTGA